MTTSVLGASKWTKDQSYGWRTCFISASIGVKLGTIKTLLQERGIEPLVLSEMLAVGTSVLDQVAEVTARADFVVAILGLTNSNANVYYEIGYAQALGKRVLVVAPPGLALDSDIVNMPFVQADAENRRVIDFALDQVLAAPKPSKYKLNGSTDKSKPIGSLSHELINQLHALGDHATEVEIASIVEEALRASGISIVVNSRAREGTADMAIWSDELDVWGGNPLLIEIKRDLQTKEYIDHTHDQVLAYLESSNSPAALVLYAEGPPSRDLLFSSLPIIMFLQTHELLERLTSSSFGSIMRELRNRVVHGTNF
ncbi:MAG: nucleotide-binding protein [Chloroflexota bacterium]|nr:nucleotide-binding protein [Chloroflexota bacterium]